MTFGLPQTAPLPASRWSEVAAVFALAALVLFFRLHIPPVYLWDEARVALNAFEMMQNTNPLIVTYNGEADLWNTKPPLAIWLSALSMRAFGVNELALRLPSALAAVMTVLAVYLFTRRVSGSRATSLVAVLILLGTGGYFQIHVTRTADFDSLLVLFISLATFRLFFAIEALGTADHKRRELYAVAGFMAGGLYTKGVAGLLMVPGYLLYVVWSGKLRAFFACRAVWLSGIFVLSSALLFLAAREIAEPGFAKAMWQLDVVSRSVGLDGHVEIGPYYYLAGLLWPWQLFWLSAPSGLSTALSAFPWSWLLPFSAALGVLSSRPLTSRASAYLLCCLTGFLATISAGEAQVGWYVAPAYPLIATLVALGLNEFCRKTRKEGTSLLQLIGKATLPASIALGVAGVIANLAKTERSLTGARYPIESQLPYFLRSFVSEHREYARIRVVRVSNLETPAVVNGKIVGMEPYDGPIEFYARKSRKIGTDVQVVDAGYAPQPGEVIIGCGDTVRSVYRTLRLLKKEGHCFAIIGPSKA